MRTSSKQPAAARRMTLIRQALQLRQPMALAAIGLAVLGLIASADLGPLTQFTGVQVATHPITALCLTGFGFWGLRMKRFGTAQLGRSLIVGTVLMICMARIMVAAVALWADTASLALFGPFPGLSGEFEAVTALALGALAAAALLRRHQGQIGTVFLVAGVGVVYNEVVKLGFGAPFDTRHVGGFTLLGLIAAAVMMVSIYVHRPLVRALFLMGDLGNQTRVMIAAAVAIPLVGGIALLLATPLGANGVQIGAAVNSVVTLALVTVLLGTTARLESTAATRRRAELALAIKNRTDPVTKSLNRFGMMEALEGAWVDYRASGTLFGLVLLDLTHFERINETFGHGSGDSVLARVSETLQSHLRDCDALGRWGGGEFLVLLKIKQPGDLAIVTARLDKALSQADSPYRAGLKAAPANLSASFGVSVMQEGDHGPAEAITRADVDLNLKRAAEADGASAQHQPRREAAA